MKMVLLFLVKLHLCFFVFLVGFQLLDHGFDLQNLVACF